MKISSLMVSFVVVAQGAFAMAASKNMTFDCKGSREPGVLTVSRDGKNAGYVGKTFKGGFGAPRASGDLQDVPALKNESFGSSTSMSGGCVQIDKDQNLKLSRTSQRPSQNKCALIGEDTVMKDGHAGRVWISGALLTCKPQ